MFLDRLVSRFKLWRRIDPLTGSRIQRVSKIRLGDVCSWVIPDNLINRNSVIYSAGAGEDISFDVALVNRFGATIHIFDPTPRAMSHYELQIYKPEIKSIATKLDFHAFGVWNECTKLKFYAPNNPSHVSHSILNLQKTKDYFEAEVKDLQSIMNDLGHTSIDLLKIDIEGAEYKVIQSIIDNNIEVKVICVEFDEAFNPMDANFKGRIRESINSLIKIGYILVHVDHPGNYTLVKEET